MKLNHIYALVTRPDPEGSELCERIVEHGGHAFHLPTIAIAPPPDHEAFQQSLGVLGQQDWLIFVSPQAVYTSVPAIRRAWPEFPPQVKFAAVGASTAKALAAAGYRVAIYPKTEWSSENLLEMPEFQAISGQHIAIIRGVGGREILEKVCHERGALVTSIMAYQRVLPAVSAQLLADLLTQQRINSIVCTAFAGVSNLQKMLPEPALKKIALIVPSERIKMLAQDLGFQTIWVARNASHEAILEILSALRDK